MLITRRTHIRLATAIAIAVTVMTGGPTTSAQAADNEVKIDNFTFAPQRVTVKVGATVTWINDDDIPHTVTSSSKLFKSKVLYSEDKFSFAFTTPGTYEFFAHCIPT